MFSTHKCDSCKKTDMTSVLKCMKARKQERLNQTSDMKPIALDLDATEDLATANVPEPMVATNFSQEAQRSEQPEEEEEDKENSIPACTHQEAEQPAECCMNPDCTRSSIELATPLRKDMCPITSISGASRTSIHSHLANCQNALTNSSERQPLTELSFRAPSLVRKSSVCKKLFFEEEEDSSHSTKSVWQESGIGMTSSPLRNENKSIESSSDDSDAFERFLSKQETERQISQPVAENSSSPIDNFIVSDNSTLSQPDDNNSHGEGSDDSFLDLCKENFILPKRTRYGKTSAETNSETATNKRNHPKGLYWSDDSESDEEFEKLGRSHEDIEEEEELSESSSSDDESQVKKDLPRFQMTTPLTEQVKSKPQFDTRVRCFKSDSPRVNKRKMVDMNFLASLSGNIADESSCRHPDAIKYVKSFKFHRNDLTNRLFKLYNQEVFSGQLPDNFCIDWNKRLTKTAGFCRYMRRKAPPTNQKDDDDDKQNDRNAHEASIQLSQKVCDSAERLRDTLIHELCHAAVWIIDGVNDGHGARWKRWSHIAMTKLPGIKKIERCHAYAIQSRFVYRCETCGQTVNRHSKSIKLNKMKCGLCHGQFELLVNTPSGKKRYSQAVKPPNQFALFVKENYQTARSNLTSDNQDTPKSAAHSQVMKLLSSQFEELKIKQKEKMNNS